MATLVALSTQILVLALPCITSEPLVQLLVSMIHSLVKSENCHTGFGAPPGEFGAARPPAPGGFSGPGGFGAAPGYDAAVCSCSHHGSHMFINKAATAFAELPLSAAAPGTCHFRTTRRPRRISQLDQYL